MKAIIIHALPTKYKVEEMREWAQEYNEDMVVTRARWLLSDDRRSGKTTPLVLYLASPTETHRLRMGTKSFRTTTNDWDLPPATRSPT